MLDCSWKQKPNDYPTSDGKPMAETDRHRDLMVASLDTLQHYFKDEPLVYVTGNLLWFYVPGDRRRHISPDLMVCFGVPKGLRNNYLMWEEGCVPQVVFEFTSSSTRGNDLGPKRDRYEALGVEEYYIFDLRERPRLRTFHLHMGRFVPVLGDAVLSNRLGLEVVADKTLRFRNPVTGEFLLDGRERQSRETELRQRESARADQEAARADQEAILRLEAERQLAELKQQMQRGQA